MKEPFRSFMVMLFWCFLAFFAYQQDVMWFVIMAMFAAGVNFETWMTEWRKQ